MRRIVVILLLLLPVVCWAGEREEVAHWRKEKEAELRAPEGWLSLVGLEFLTPGEHQLRVDKDGNLTTEGPGNPVGKLEVDGAGVRLADAASNIRVNGGAAAPDMRLRHDQDEDKIEYGSSIAFIIQRGEKYALRIKNTQSARRRKFRGMLWYPVEPRYRVIADFVPAAAGATIAVPTAIGTVLQMTTPGTVRFILNGAQYTLTPVLESGGAKQLFFIFRDMTAGKSTYGAGRFLYSELPREGKVVLDFNKAENPPCAFTPYATCPRPPKGNVLGTAIAAGEKAPADYHSAE